MGSALFFPLALLLWVPPLALVAYLISYGYRLRRDSFKQGWVAGHAAGFAVAMFAIKEMAKAQGLTIDFVPVEPQAKEKN